MTTKQLQKNTLDNIIKLDSVKNKLSGKDREKLDQVISNLKDTAGDAVSKTNAAQVLDVSRQTLDRWIEKGKLPAVKGKNGRQQIPTDVVQRLGREVKDIKAIGQTRSVLADALRRAAKDIDPKKPAAKKTAAKKPAAKKPAAKKPAAKKPAAKKPAAKKTK